MRKRYSIILAGLLLTACRMAPMRGHNAASKPAAETTQSSSTSGSLPVPTFKTFPVYTDRAPRHTHYAPSGYMGDSDLSMAGAYVETPHGQGPCLKVNYRATGPKGWAGIYWQDPANNWGDVPGRAGFDLRGATRLTFWARGENGGERIHEFRIGGIVGQYPDSDVVTLGNVRLTKQWKQFSLDLRKKDLRHIIGGFGFFVSKADSPGGMAFYLTDIVYEGPEGLSSGSPDAVMSSSSTYSSTIPALSSAPVTAPEPKLPTSTKEMQVKQVDQGLQVSFSSQLLFGPGRAVLQPNSGKVLDQLIGLLSAYPNNPVLIEGHTDSTGNPQFNLKLSELRASSVRDYLLKQGGFAESRFKVIGYGDTRPVADNTKKAGRGLNRRVEVTILKSQ